MSSEREQMLVDICFQIGFLMSDPRYNFVKMTTEEKAEYISKQLQMCGFPTKPCGGSWGKLVK